MNKIWTKLVNKTFDVNLEVTSIKARYCKNAAALSHWLHYLYKHQLTDLWRGWQKYENGELDYTYKKPGARPVHVSIKAADLRLAFDRLDMIPQHFKRIRWYGVFADGVRGKTMDFIGLERIERQEKQDEADMWEVIPGSHMRLVRFTNSGVILKDDSGEELEFTTMVDYRPAGIKIGKRIIYRSPGGKR